MRGGAAWHGGAARRGVGEASPLLGDFLFSKLKKNILKNLKIGLKCQNFMHGAVGYDTIYIHKDKYIYIFGFGQRGCLVGW